MSLFTRYLDFLPPISSVFIVTGIVAPIFAISVWKGLPQHPASQRHWISSPKTTILPKLSQDEIDDLPYPPNVFPGGRDVTSPYGTSRVYEWGPEDGRKVLLVHGISTPCLSLGFIANGLVSHGCRVILMDLWGRGYSDSPDLPHDSRLYSTQILLAITSSPISWTPSGFSVIGYSLGGGICVDFAGNFPDLVKSVVLLAPGGLIRPRHFGWLGKMMLAGVLSDSVLCWIARRRLKKSPSATTVINDKSKIVQAGKEDLVGQEIQGVDFDEVRLSKGRPGVTVAAAVQWQIAHHEGFVRSYVSSLQYASISGRGESWRKLRDRKDKVIIFVGGIDAIIVKEELEEDVRECLGEEAVEWRVFEGGHEFPITKAGEVVNELVGMWGL